VYFTSRTYRVIEAPLTDHTLRNVAVSDVETAAETVGRHRRHAQVVDGSLDRLTT